MTHIDPLPDGIETPEDLPDSAELADAYERKAAEIEAGESTNPAQDAGKSAVVAGLRQKAWDIRGRLGL